MFSGSVARQSRSVRGTFAPMDLQLDRHRARRAQQLPTVSVLAGAPPSIVPLYRRALEREGRGIVQTSASARSEVERAWVENVVRSNDLLRAALENLAHHAQQSPLAMSAELAGRSSAERDLYFRTLTPSRSMEGVRRVLIDRQTPESLSTILALIGEDRAPGLLRETIIRVEAEVMEPPRPVLARPVEPKREDAARSEAEAFLQRSLSASARLKGLFELNGKLPLEDGRVLEVDFLSRDLRIA